MVSRGLLIMTILLGMSRGAWADDCLPNHAGNAQASIKLISDNLVPDYRHMLTRPQIGALGGNGHMPSDRRHAGLTQSRTAFSVKPTLRFYRLSGGRLCAQLAEVEASWRMTRLQVDIAVEYGRASCPYREILAHENQHVAIAQKQFVAAQQGLRAKLAELVSQLRPFVIKGTPDQTARQVAAHLLAGVQPVLGVYNAEAARANAALDTPENYRAVSARCADW